MTQSPQRYSRISSIGFGAMGEVWRAEDNILGRTVAVKQLRVDPARGIDAQAVQRMVREARIAAGLHHRHIVAVFDLYIMDGQPNVVMEFVDGESLAQRIRRGPALSSHQVAQLGAQISSALTLAHQHGVVHRDVKPANILLDVSGDAKLADFGIARGLGDAALTDAGNMVGTIAFMAPEVARSGQATAASDVWSLGATLFAALEGHSPYDDGSNPSTTQMLIRLVTESAPASGRAGAIAPLLAAMMDADPIARPSAASVATAILEALESSAGADVLSGAAAAKALPTNFEPKTRLRPVIAEPVLKTAADETTLRVLPKDVTSESQTTEIVKDSIPWASRRRASRFVLIGLLVVGSVVGSILLIYSRHNSTEAEPLANNRTAGLSSSPPLTGPILIAPTARFTPTASGSRTAPPIHTARVAGLHHDPEGDAIDPDITSVQYERTSDGLLIARVRLTRELARHEQLDFDFNTDGNGHDGANKVGCHPTAIGADYEVSINAGEHRADLDKLTHCVVHKDGSNSIDFHKVGTIAFIAHGSTYTIRMSRSRLQSVVKPGLAVLTFAPHSGADEAPNDPHGAFYPALVAG